MLDEISVVDGPTVWTGPSLPAEAWQLQICDDVVRAVEDIRDQLRSRGCSLATVDGKDFRVPALVELADTIKDRLAIGPGFVVLSGLGIGAWSEDEAKMIYWGLGSLLGDPRPQNLQGDRVHVVADVPVVSPGQTAPGGSTSNNEILPHTENARPPYPPRLICLMCIYQAPVGGESKLYSGHELHNRLLRERPDLLPRLYQDFTFGRHAEEYPDGRRTDLSPVFSRRTGSLRVRYGRYWMTVAEKTTGQPMDSAGRDAADAIDEILADESMPARFCLEPGDIVVVDNEVVLHARSAFNDGSGVGERRRLLRLWLD